MKNIVEMARAAQRDDRLASGVLYGKLADEIEQLQRHLEDAQIEIRNLGNMGHRTIRNALEQIAQGTKDAEPPYRAMGRDQMAQVARETLRNLAYVAKVSARDPS